MIPHWRFLHNELIKDFQFELEQRNELRALLKKHPDDGIGEILREMIKLINNKLKKMHEAYEEVYCDKPNV